MKASGTAKTIAVGSVDVNRELAMEILWNYLNNSARSEKMFKRSAMVNGFSVDFFASEYGLVIQIAGEDEFDLLKMLMSSFTEMMLRRLGYTIVSISSEDVLLRCEMVLRSISEAISELREVQTY